MNTLLFSEQFHFHEFVVASGHYTDNRQGTGLHYIGYMIHGHSRLVSETEDIEVMEGELMYIPLGCRYQSYWYGTPEVRFISLGFTCFPDTENRAFPLQMLRPDERELALLRQIPLNRAADCGSVGLLFQLFGLLMQRLRSENSSPREATVREALRLMNECPQRSVPELARRCHVSESSFYAWFHELTGKTPVDMRHKLLAEKAVTLLTTTNYTVEAISALLGLGSAAYLRRILRAQTGQTPREIRAHTLPASI